jgi:hypothetical protein
LTSAAKTLAKVRPIDRPFRMPLHGQHKDRPFLKSFDDSVWTSRDDPQTLTHVFSGLMMA